MSDSTLNKIVRYGTQAERLAFTPDPASGSQVLYIWFETDNSPDTYVWDGSVSPADWVHINAGGGGGGLTLLASLTASTSASLDFATRNATGQSGAMFQSDFDVYVIEVVSLKVATNAAGVRLRMSTDGGSSYDATGGNYSWQTFLMAYNATAATGSINDTSLALAGDNASAAATSLSGEYRLYSPLSTSLYKIISGHANMTDQSRTTDSLGITSAAKYLVSGTAVNAFQILASTGNLASGTVYVYGIAKS